MRLLHTADWHLGRLFHGVQLVEDQAWILDRIVDIAVDARLDAVVIAGDVYDRAVPPTEAVSLLDDVLARIVLDLRLPVIIIAGNHDSPQRLGFGRRLLATSRLHVAGEPTAAPSSLIFEDLYGPIRIYPVPYADPSVVRGLLEDDGVQDHGTAMAKVLARTLEAHPPLERSVVVAHAFVSGGEESESERPLSMGGASAVDAACFLPFSYAALGHLHRPQKVGGDHVRYAGSILKYSFSEAAHRKSVSIVEVDGRGRAKVEPVELVPRRDLRAVSGRLDEILAGGDGGGREDYLHVTLLDRGAVFDAMGKLREVYPNVLHVEKASLDGQDVPSEPRPDPARMAEESLLGAFVREVTGEDPSEDERAAFRETVDALHRREREDAP